MVTLRIGSGVALAGGRATWAGGDAVPDGDLLRADEDVLDEQPQHPLAVFDGGGGGVAAQLGEEAFQVIGELEIGVPVGGLGVGGAEAAVVVDLPAGGAGRGAVVAVSAGRAGGQALQQGGDLGVAGGVALVVSEPLGGSLESPGRHDGRDGDLDPFLAGPVDGLGGPRYRAALQAGPPVQPW